MAPTHVAEGCAEVGTTDTNLSPSLSQPLYSESLDYRVLPRCLHVEHGFQRKWLKAQGAEVPGVECKTGYA